MESSNTGLTRTLLACGLVAGPLYVGVSLVQAFTRDGFDITRHTWSLLANGDLGWLQITNFLVTGLLTIACAVGMRQALRGQRGGTWGPVLVAIYGLGLMAAGVFTADPMDGFPRGTPLGPPAAISWHGILHLVCGAIGFAAMIAACFVLARRFAGLGQRGWAWYSRATGIVFFAAFAGIASGSSQPAIVLSFVSAVILVWVWLALVSARLRTATAWR